MTTTATPARRRTPQPKCPLRPGEPCTLCQLDVTGPQDCPVVFLVMGDEELQAEWAARQRAARGLS
ncbi:MAG: DUF6767 domain-containing protein [Propionicimonas sp.]|uniref:DUF6767 domain-containing protein n=1 Tax=Propionicimonas sp. TaxID=1955623 RepID=UPI002B1F422E|nr:DUF6767 domain-containing protein [Propionicimonas sp.]MEA4943649.1 DUF6767 domain-containing protein [Propionicimonas sp.]